MLKSVVCSGSCNLAPVGEQGQCYGEMLAPLQRTINLVLKTKLPSFLHRTPCKPESQRSPFFLSHFFFQMVMFRRLSIYIFLLVLDSGLGTEAVLKVKLNE